VDGEPSGIASLGTTAANTPLALREQWVKSRGNHARSGRLVTVIPDETLTEAVAPSAPWHTNLVLQPSGVYRVLRDGTTVQVRLLTPADGDRLRAFHSGLSLESTRMRYFVAKPKLSDKDVKWLTDIDVTNRCALVAIERDEIIAVGRWMRPKEGSSDAEVAFLTADGQQGRGIGTELLAMLIELAPAYAITEFTASVLLENHPMTNVLRRCGYRISVTTDAGVREMVIDLTTPFDS
jgi:RimJ/RimL family protein N-acetyltransferase